MGMTRRRLLAASPAAGLAAIAPVALANTRCPDPILDLARRRDELLAACVAVSAESAAAAKTLPTWAQPGDCPIGSRRGWPELDFAQPAFRNCWPMLSRRPSLREVRQYNRMTLAWAEGNPTEVARRRAEGRERIRAWVGRRREQRALKDAAGITALDARADALCDAFGDVEDRLIVMPATTPAGVAAKLRVIRGEPEPDQEGYEVPAEWLENVIADLEAMAA